MIDNTATVTACAIEMDLIDERLGDPYVGTGG